MNTKTTDKKQDQRKNILITALIQLLLVLVCYLIIAWREPFPPIPEYGIELNFGFVQEGLGERLVPAAPTSDQSADVDESQEVPTQDVVEEVEVIEPDMVPDLPGDVKVEESKQPEKVPVKTEEKKAVESKPEPAKQQEESKSNPVPIKPSEEQKSSVGDKKTDEPQGDEKGVLDERALYGNQGKGQSGASLDMTGWKWDSQPKPKDNSDESGEITFEITIDEDGYIVGIKTLRSTVTPATERIYRYSVEQLSFSRTSGYIPAARSKGTITFIIRSR